MEFLHGSMRRFHLFFVLAKLKTRTTGARRYLKQLYEKEEENWKIYFQSDRICLFRML